MISSAISGGPTSYVVRDIDAGVWLPDLVHSQSLRAVAQRWSACLVCTRLWIPIQLFEKQEKNPHSEFNSREDLRAEWIGPRVTQSPPQ